MNTNKKIGTSLWFLSQALNLIEQTKIIYCDYLNSNNKDYWDDIMVPKFFGVCYAQIVDNKLMLKKHFPKLKDLIKKHINFLNKIDNKNEEIFSLLFYFHTETKSLFFSELKRFDISINDLLNLDIEKLKNKIIEMTEYDEINDPKNFIENFIENLKK